MRISCSMFVSPITIGSTGFFAPHQRAAPFRLEESLRRFIHECVFFQVIFQFARIRRVTSSWNGFGLTEGPISPRLKTFIACVIGQPKQFCCLDFARAKWNLHGLHARQIGGVGIDIQRPKSKITDANNSYFPSSILMRCRSGRHPVFIR